MTITDKAIEAAVELVAAHSGPQSLPGRAVDLIDEAGARRQVARVGLLPDLREFDEKIVNVRRGKESAIDARDFERASHLRDQEKQLLAAKSEREKQWKSGDLDILVEVDEALIRRSPPTCSPTLRSPLRGAPADAAPGGMVNADLFRGEGSIWLIC